MGCLGLSINLLGYYWYNDLSGSSIFLCYWPSLEVHEPHFYCSYSKGIKAEKVDEFRPIALCNLSYKIIAKIIATRLKIFLPGLISPTQAAFVLGRGMMDNLIISHEIMNHIIGRKVNSHLWL